MKMERKLLKKKKKNVENFLELKEGYRVLE